jgi:endonuclease/exonuclease/phosphatase family metal-dependent hydrolase
MREPETRTELVVATYNVHRWVGSDGRSDPGRARAVAAQLDADVLALQEVEGAGPGRPEPLDVLARSLGYRTFRGPTLEGRRGRFGNALLTRLPVRIVRQIDLSVPGREPRGALSAELEGGGMGVTAIATHLGLAARERRWQVARLAAEVDRATGPLVLVLGDMNEWLRAIGSLRPLHRRLGHAQAVRSFPARRPLLPLDRIWVRPRCRVARLGAVRTPLARLASDHLPVRAVVHLGAASGGVRAAGGVR